MDKDRRLAFLILKDIDKQAAWSNLSLNGYIAKGEADEPAFIRELVYGVLRNQLLLDYNIDSFLKKPNIGVSERVLLRMGFYQLSMMDGVAEHAAVAETVKLADAFVKGKKAFVNAVLRSFQRSGAELKCPKREDGDIKYLSVKYSAHESVVRLWTEAYGSEKAEELLKNIQANDKAIRFDLGRRVRNQLRIIPELRFFIDDSLDYIDRIDELLKK